jgi:hypothetical protein
MCTVTFIPREGGYLLGMNRDERFSREPAAPPRAFGAAVYPHEPSGGTWIAANRRGVALALLNRTDGERQASGRRSRGEIIPATIAAEDAVAAGELLGRLDLAEIAPFRLIGFFPSEQAVREWTWDGRTLETAKLPWQARHWFSSGLGDREAREQRGAVCQAAWKDPAAGSPEWLRDLHRSHLPERGAYSICVHRGEAGTLSYTEVQAGPDVSMVYQPGSPCRPAGPAVEIRLS